MLSNNFILHTIKSFFPKQSKYHHLKFMPITPLCISRCCTSVHRECKSSSRFTDSDELRSTDAAKAEKAIKTKRQRKSAKSKMKIKTSDPNVRNTDRGTLDFGPGGDQGNRREKADVRGGVVVEKLKSMRMMNESNSEHMMDIDESLYYYSLITSKTFQDIADKFFVELYCEFTASEFQPDLHIVRELNEAQMLCSKK